MPVRRANADRPMSLSTTMGDDVLFIRSMRGAEQLGRPFSYELELLSEDFELVFEDIIGTNSTIRVEVRGSGPRYINGFFSVFEQTEPLGRYARYRAHLVPWAWFLSRTADCRIFQDKPIPAILREVFGAHGFNDVEDRLSDEYRTWPYRVQYHETDLNLVHRLMEEEGIYYFFNHDDGSHLLTMCDSLGSHEPIGESDEIQFLAPSDARSDIEHISRWSSRKELRPEAFSAVAFDYQHTKANLETRSQLADEGGGPSFEVFEPYAGYSKYGEGEKYTRRRIEEMRVGQEVVRGSSNSLRLRVGSTFRLGGFDRADQCRQYLITSTTYEIVIDPYESQDHPAIGVPVVACHFTAIPANQPFRIPRTTPRPNIPGPQTAYVVGPDGQEIYTDKLGRIKVLFHWDRYATGNEDSSCWIRVAQGWAGKNWGAISIPRVGQEVIVQFVNGDPDQPLVTGRVYNDVSKPPYALPQHASMTTMKSNSTPGSEGFNEIRFQDKKDAEQLFIHAQKNHDLRVKNDRFDTIEREDHLIVATDRFEHVQHDRHGVVDHDDHLHVKNDHHVQIDGKQATKIAGSRSLRVQGDVIEILQGGVSTEVTDDHNLRATEIVIEATTALTLKCGNNSIVIDASGVSIKGSKLTLEGDMINLNSGPGAAPGAFRAATAVDPLAATAATESDNADPGSTNRVEKQGEKLAPHNPKQGPDKTWIEIELIDEEDNPVPGELYEVVLPDGETVATGTLDENGWARVDWIDPGMCKVTFPRLDQAAWEPA